MGVEYDPGVLYGFKTENTQITCEGFQSYPFCSCCYPDGHVFGEEVCFEGLKESKFQMDDTVFGELMRKYFGIECDYYLVQAGDACFYHCDARKISFLSWIREEKPEWSLKKCKRVHKELAGFECDSNDKDAFDEEEGVDESAEEGNKKVEKDKDERSSESLQENAKTNDDSKEKKDGEGKESAGGDETDSKYPKLELK